jgi:hypothetical protein
VFVLVDVFDSVSLILFFVSCLFLSLNFFFFFFFFFFVALRSFCCCFGESASFSSSHIYSNENKIQNLFKIVFKKRIKNIFKFSNQISFDRPAEACRGLIAFSFETMTSLYKALGLATAAAFTGAAFYINWAEHPARTELDDRAFLKQWKPSYEAGLRMQSSLVLATLACGAGAYYVGGDQWALAGGVVMFMNMPFTMLAIMPLNLKLKAIKEGDADKTSRSMLATWNRLHAGRTALGLASTVLFIVAHNQ